MAALIKSMSSREIEQMKEAEKSSWKAAAAATTADMLPINTNSNSLRTNSSDQDIVKIGYLHIKRPPGNSKLRFKAWQKKYFVLRDISFNDGVSTLEMFDTDYSYQSQTTAPEYTLDLKNVTKIDSYDQSKRFPHTFTIMCLSQIPLLTLGCYSAIEKSVWMEAVTVLADKRKLVYRYKDFTLASEKERQRRSSLSGKIQYEISGNNGFKPKWSNGPPTPPRRDTTFIDFVDNKCGGHLVKVQSNSYSDKSGLHGDYYMNVSHMHITLTTVEALKEVIKWPIKHITKFKSEDLMTGENLLTLEANLFAGMAEGSFKFLTKHGRQLIKKVKDASAGTQYILVGNQRRNGYALRRNGVNHHQASVDCAAHTNNMLSIPSDKATMERSQSSPNLLDVRVVFNSHKVRYDSGLKFSKTLESPEEEEVFVKGFHGDNNALEPPQSFSDHLVMNYQRNQYLDITEDEKMDAAAGSNLEPTTPTATQSYLEILESDDAKSSDPVIRSDRPKSDVDSDDRRDSGFSDVTDSTEEAVTPELVPLAQNSQNSQYSDSSNKQPPYANQKYPRNETKLAIDNNFQQNNLNSAKEHDTESSNVIRNNCSKTKQKLQRQNEIDIKISFDDYDSNQSKDYLQIEATSLTTPPPLPPKQKKREDSVVFMDYVENSFDTSSNCNNQSGSTSRDSTNDEKVDENHGDDSNDVTDVAPPIPERSYAKTLKNKTCRVSDV